MTQGTAPATLPSGTITFLFTDIEGSTRLWENHPDAMRTALARHDALLRGAVTTAGGIVFKTVGDAFCAAFSSAPIALQAAMDAQTVLLAEPWPEATPLRVRMALHTGTVEERDNDYFGPVLNRVARLLSAGHGGQTLLSVVTQALCRDTLPGGLHLLDLGSHRLKDLERPEHVYQANAPGLPDTFPPLKTLDTTPNNLPQQVTSFIGREKPISDVTALLSKTRLLTLTGSGGSGKTRLSLQVAADVLDAYPDGAWQVELAPLSDPALVPQTVAQVLGVKEQKGQTLTQTLTGWLNDKTLLLVLDNCEHLLSACAPFTAAVMRAGPNVRVLATSREPLGIGGETTYRVPSLSLPDPQQGKSATVESVSQYEAVRLFIDRAQSVKTDFNVTNTNAPALAQLCYRLDGIPLAIELAAARVRSLPVEQINDKLDRRFRLLTGGDRSALPRQQTLRALVDWSYDLLTDTEKTLFARLSVFAGGWTLQSAESVCGYEPAEDGEVLDVLTSLADKSLVVADAVEGETRYRMLETLRQYGAEKRDASGETGTVKTKCRDYFVALVKEAEPQLRGADQAVWLTRLETEHDNLRAVLDDCATPGAEAEEIAAEVGLRLVGALRQFWLVRGYFTEGREHGTRALERGRVLNGAQQQMQRSRAKALVGIGSLADNQGDYVAARSLLEESLLISRALGDKRGSALALSNLGNVAKNQGDYVAARSLHEESLIIFRELGDKWASAIALNNLGNVAFNQGDYEAARSLYEESLVLYRALNNKRGCATALSNLGLVAHQQGDYAAARSLNQESLVLYRELSDKRGCATTLSNLGSVAFNQGDYEAARSLHEESLVLCRALGDKRGSATALINLGSVVHQQGDYEAARLLHEESLVIFRELGDKRGIAYCLEGVASVYSGKAAAPKAVVLFGAANALRERLGAPLTPFEQAEQDKEIAKARLALDESAFSAAWEQGCALDWEQAVEYALSHAPHAVYGQG